MKFNHGDRVYHSKYKEGHVLEYCQIEIEKEFLYVEFDDYNGIMEENIIKVPEWTLKKIK